MNLFEFFFLGFKLGLGMSEGFLLYFSLVLKLRDMAVLFGQELSKLLNLATFMLMVGSSALMSFFLFWCFLFVYSERRFNLG